MTLSFTKSTPEKHTNELPKYSKNISHFKVFGCLRSCHGGTWPAGQRLDESEGETKVTDNHTQNNRATAEEMESQPSDACGVSVMVVVSYRVPCRLLLGSLLHSHLIAQGLVPLIGCVDCKYLVASRCTRQPSPGLSKLGMTETHSPSHPKSLLLWCYQGPSVSSILLGGLAWLFPVPTSSTL